MRAEVPFSVETRTHPGRVRADRRRPTKSTTETTTENDPFHDRRQERNAYFRVK
jgi:hypothetical protein